ncbi:MAG: hypothetical protein LQ345_001020 [Seirophora villosa]|nr:MAG: hypothetical protein LQ345_001020 [Seirophora villosa]
MLPAGSVSASQEVMDLLEPILVTAVGHEPQKRTTRCRGSHSSPAPASSTDRFFELLATYIPGVMSLWIPLTGNNVPEPPPLHQTAQIFQNEMLRLAPFADMDAEARSQAAVAIALPAWLAGTEEACHIADAARRTFGRMLSLENPPSSVYTAAGYELCRISYDAFECTGPGRIMTLEHDGDLSVATITSTPLLHWSAEPVVFSARRGLAREKMTRRIDSFVVSQKPQRIILCGTGVYQPSFVEALRASSINQYLDDQPPLPARHLLTFGAAQAAKDLLETQFDDCLESRECDGLRRKADAISGPFRPPVPSIWPSVTAP